MRRVHTQSKNALRRTLNEKDDRGARLTKTLKAVLLQCGGSVLITMQTMQQMEDRYYFLDIEASPEGLRISVRAPEEGEEK